jgi:F-type H+-transporting ATPase subunit epsilon
MPLRLEIVTAERVVFSDDVDLVSAPAAEGRVGILPRHEVMLTVLLPGEFHYTKDGVTHPFAISGGFMEVLPDRVTVLADTAERGDEIDEARAEAARQRAEQRMRDRQSSRDLALAEAELRRAMVRLQVARLRKSRPQR